MKHIALKSALLRFSAIFLLAFSNSLSVSAQYYLNVFKKNGQKLQYIITDLDSINISGQPITPEDNPPVVPTDTLAEGGLYLGVIGFHRSFYMQPISILNATTKNTFKNFINNMTSENGTLLYYSVDQAIEALNNVVVPEKLTTVAMITFTDGLDQGSNTHLWQQHNYKEEWLYDPNDDYLTAIQGKILKDSVGGVPITSYSIGLKGDQELNTAKFRSDIKKLASADSLGVVVDSIKEVNENFQKIAKSLNSLYNYQNIPITIPGLSTGDRVRIAFDIRKADADVTSQDAVSSRLYIEGTYNLRKQLLTDVVYEGLTSLSGDTIYGELDEYGHSKFLFEKVLTNDNKLIVAENIKEFYLVKDGLNNYWQKNREFEHPAEKDIVIEKGSAIIMLVLDCSSSLVDEKKNLEKTDFYKVKSHAISFIDALYNSYNNSTTGSGEGIDNDGYEYVDLGLSVLWATYNVGASKPEDYGNYYAWGETETKANYNWSTYRYCNGSSSTLTKYNYSSSYGTVDNKTKLDQTDDVAHVKWGGDWRMPTQKELEELLNSNNCTWTWTIQNGVKGYKVTSKKAGYTDKSIFIPASGYYSGTSRSESGSYVYLWSSSLNTSNSSKALYTYYSSSENGSKGSGKDRYYGFAVRPVISKPVEYEYVDLGLSVKWATFNVGATAPEEYGDYYAWGETEPKATYSWSNYKYCNGSSISLTKYNTSSSYGTVDNKTALDLADDVAHVKWGGNWRLPTKTELGELFDSNNCTWTSTTLNGVSGYKITSKKTGYTDKSIFLPAAGWYNDSGYCSGKICYWTKTLKVAQGAYLRFGDGWDGSATNKPIGASVRPVCP